MKHLIPSRAYVETEELSFEKDAVTKLTKIGWLKVAVDNGDLTVRVDFDDNMREDIFHNNNYGWAIVDIDGESIRRNNGVIRLEWLADELTQHIRNIARDVSKDVYREAILAVLQWQEDDIRNATAFLTLSPEKTIHTIAVKPYVPSDSAISKPCV